MPVQSGTSTPWREIEHPGSVDGSVIVYFRPGEASGAADLLAEQLRLDGVMPSLGPAIRVSQEAILQLAWYGTDENGEERLCDEDGWAEDGDELSSVSPCVLAIIGLDEA